jgi:L-2-hydroxyglutarate oxidase LhgO
MDAEITVIGAGVVGLAITENISRESGGIFLLEKHSTFGQETSSRNSEVIHAGIYYPEGSLKSTLCLRGKRLLYNYCSKYNIPFRRCGKLIVAANENEVSIIESIRQTGIKNGVDDLEIIGPGRIGELEPRIFALKAIYSPSTGIVDSHSLMKQLETNIINNGGNIVYGSEVRGISRIEGGYLVIIKDSDDTNYKFTSRVVINSAGLYADAISHIAGISDPKLAINFCKGEYFRLNPPLNRFISRLVYPVPHHNLDGIGIHVTVDMSGGVKLGPDVTYMPEKRYDYTVDAGKRDLFYTSAKKFLPFLNPGDISPEMAGIRPKLQKQGEPVRDFYIMEESARGLPGFINLIGIESPGLTSSLAIAEYVRNLVRI